MLNHNITLPVASSTKEKKHEETKGEETPEGPWEESVEENLEEESQEGAEEQPGLQQGPKSHLYFLSFHYR